MTLWFILLTVYTPHLEGDKVTTRVEKSLLDRYSTLAECEADKKSYKQITGVEKGGWHEVACIEWRVK